MSSGLLLRGGFVALCVAPALGACARKSGGTASPPSPSSSVQAALPPSPAVSSSSTAAKAEASDAISPVPTQAAFDAGVNACRLAYGPIQQSWTGAATLVITEAGLELITSKGGVPTITRMTVPGLGGPRIGKVALETEAARVSLFPCAVAGPNIFCMDVQGAVTRTSRGDVTGRVVGRGRPGTRIAAVSFGGSHAVVAYLVEGRKDDGTLLEAYASVDDAPPFRLSEEGSGATSVSLAARGAGALALLVDARSAMTPVHARALGWKDGQLDVGADAVVFVGGGAEQHTTGALGTTGAGAAFGLLPIAGDTGFGVASMRIGDPPAIDEKTVWSMYPFGLDPAPIAATTGTTPVRVARVRPVDARPDAPRGVELGKLDETGAFTPHGMISTAGRAFDLAVATDSLGALWLYYTDAAGSWLERRVCP